MDTERKTDAILIAIGCIQRINVQSYQEECARRDIINVLEEAITLFEEKAKPKKETISDYYPSGYREPICSDCTMCDCMKDELVEKCNDVFSDAECEVIIEIWNRVFNPLKGK